MTAVAVSPEAIESPARRGEGRAFVILLSLARSTKDDDLLVVEGIAEHHIGASISLAGVILKGKI